jgi:hypothetical protein
VGIRGSTPRRAENHTLADELTQKSCALLCPIRIRESLTTMDITNLGWEPNTQHAELGPDAEAESAVASLRIALAWLDKSTGADLRRALVEGALRIRPGITVLRYGKEN